MTEKNDVWYTLEDIVPQKTTDKKLYCLSVSSPDHQFQIGKIGVPTHNSNTEEGKMIQEMKGEISLIVGSILRLGRAAGVHMILATQRPDAKLITGEQKNNLGVRICCGWVNSIASDMILASADGTQINGSVKGRLFIRIYNSGYHGQGLFQTQSWIDDWLKSRGLNPDGSPLSSPKKRVLENNIDKFADMDLDSHSGIDNTRRIEQMREEDNYAQTFSDNKENVSNEEDNLILVDDINDVNNGGMGRPDVGSGSSRRSYSRPEDDWDVELEDLIEENNS